jgi:hypothetical protein
LLLALLPLIGLAPSADATGGAFCTISGTINFVPSGAVPTQGTWSIDPALISCQGIFRAYERITGPGRFTGSGVYSEIPGGSGSCLQHVGSGTVDYMVPTSAADVHINEAHEFVLVGAGAFSTPSLNGSFQVTPPYEGDCVTGPVTKANFVAQGLLVRTPALG